MTTVDNNSTCSIIRICDSPLYDPFANYYMAATYVCSGGAVIYRSGINKYKATFMDYTSGHGLKTINLVEVPEGIGLITDSPIPTKIFHNWGQLYRFMQLDPKCLNMINS